MGTIVKEHTFVDGTPARPEQMNANFDVIFAVINSNIDFDNLKASLFNVVNGILKLDSSGKVALAQIPDTLTGKDADTLDTKHYAQVATDIAAAIAVHAAIVAAHHTATDPTAAIAAHAALTSVHHTKTVSGNIDHGSIGGLADDDHTQYLKKNPDYDSNWSNIAADEKKVFTHSLGTTDLLVDVQGKNTVDAEVGITNQGTGGISTGGDLGWHWRKLTTSQITVWRGVSCGMINQVRVRLWKL